MKNTNYIINGVLAIAIIILFVLQFKNGKKEIVEKANVTGDSTYSHLPIAYIRTDSLLEQYNFYNDLNEALLQKIENQKLAINKKEKDWQKEVLEFQQKAQLNAFVSLDRQRQEEMRLGKQQQELEQLANQARETLAIEQMKMHQQCQDTILAALKIFNTPQKYQVIFSNVGTDNLFYADDSYDITREVIDFLNARYVPEKK